MGCEICQPSVRGYTVALPDGFPFEKLRTYFQDTPASKFRVIDNHTLWAEDDLFFEMMDYLQAHTEAKAAPAKPLTPLVIDGELKELEAFGQQREASWIDQLIRDQAIVTHYQPIVKMAAGRPQVIGHELLSRGLDQDGGIIPPFRMFEAARVRNRLFSLDRLCRLESIRNAGPTAEGMLFINFIPTAIYVPEHCLASTFELVREMDLKPEQVVFEVVETDEVQDIRHLKTILDYYRSHGFRYALDDVGTGYNQVEKIKQLKPDIVKLAREHVNGISDDWEKRKAALEVAELTHSLGGLALAEGVETAADLHCLQEIGYDLFQGYYLGKPGPKPIKEIVFT